MKKNSFKIIAILIVTILIIGALYLIYMNAVHNENIDNESVVSSNMNIVLSLEDEIKDNTAWCGTFNLIWNDLKDELAKQDIVFTPQLKIVENLNRETFNKSYLDESSYYKFCGSPSLELKEQVKQEIKKKFNETSSIIDELSWTEEPNKYILYAMLKKEFKFQNVFDELSNGNFGEYKNVKYFGITPSTKGNTRKQVRVLYYTSKENFAVEIETTGNDKVIISRGNDSDNFLDMYNEIIEKHKNYEGSNMFGESDILRIPEIKFNLKKEISELEGKEFLFSDGTPYEIEKALQTIKFELDKKGGKIKSEAGMGLKATSLEINSDKPREFIADDTFAIFLIEQNKDLPYFAAKISDISNVQNI